MKENKSKPIVRTLKAMPSETDLTSCATSQEMKGQES